MFSKCFGCKWLHRKNTTEFNSNDEESKVNQKTVEGKFNEDDVKSLAEEVNHLDEIEFLQTEFVDGSFTVLCESLKSKLSQ